MQRKWVIEVVADFRDKGKNDAIDQQVRMKAAQLNAAVILIADGIATDVAAYSDDFFVGRQELDILQQDLVDTGPVRALPQGGVKAHVVQEEEGFSDEFINSLGKS